ncbi:hypothetical protein [Georgenia faecalis]|uniref:hypothetical protein n=1 Tax=Georgenia faecalis TaxID=2483799 RepID=UPI000FD91FBA|nr:hypothetical protein [Georgenia faecalis]
MASVLFLLLGGGLLVLCVVVAVVVLLVVLPGHTSSRLPTQPGKLVVARRHVARATAIGFAVAVVIFGFMVTSANGLNASGAGPILTFGLAPAAATLVLLGALLVGELTLPAPVSTVSATHVPAPVATIAPPGLRRLLWAWVALLTVCVVVFGVMSGDGTFLPMAPVQVDGSVITQGVGPFPGWSYGPALLAASALVATCAEFVLRHIARRPAAVTTGDDVMLRRVSATRVLRGAQLGVAVTLSGVLVYGGTGIELAINSGTGVIVLTLGVITAVTALVLTLVPPRWASAAGPARTTNSGANGPDVHAVTHDPPRSGTA